MFVARIGILFLFVSTLLHGYNVLFPLIYPLVVILTFPVFFLAIISDTALDTWV